MATLDIRSVRKSYGFTDVIHGIDLKIEHGDFAVILGPSGCGKSTLLRMIAGLEAITGGEIAIDGKVVNALEPRERDIAMVFQNYALYPHMSVAENMSYALRLAGAARALVAEKVGAVARILGLGDLLARRPSQLSGGQRQRVAMGRAIIREPKVFLFDEPLSNLDAKLRNQMRTELKRLHLRLGATSILVTHDQVEAMSLANRLIVMNGGRVEQVGAPGDVYARPATLFVAGFIGSLPMNFFTGAVDPEGRTIVLEGGIRLPWRGTAGQGVTVGIRPDAFVPADDTPFGGTIDLVEDLGSVKLIHVGGDVSGDAGGFVVALPPDSTPAPGEVIGVAVKAKDMHVFDTGSGTRLQEKDGTTA